MARKAVKKTTIVLPVNFTGTVYDHNTRTYVSVRTDGTITQGRFNEKGTNVGIQAASPFAVNASR